MKLTMTALRNETLNSDRIKLRSESRQTASKPLSEVFHGFFMHTSYSVLCVWKEVPVVFVSNGTESGVLLPERLEKLGFSSQYC